MDYIMSKFPKWTARRLANALALLFAGATLSFPWFGAGPIALLVGIVLGMAVVAGLLGRVEATKLRRNILG